jgi:endo-1,4-beta-mannosidase
MNDPSQQPRLEAYVKDLCGTFANDTRILGWDVFNEPICSVHVTQSLLDLLTNVFAWCRSTDPIQPLTSPLSTSLADSGDFNKFPIYSKIIYNN